MGLLRLLLAFAVMLSHVGYPRLLGDSRLAVQVFYVISGFLVAFVLRKDAAYGNVKTFYLNRALRLYPIYWVVAGAALVARLAFGDLLAKMHELNPAAIALLAGSNLLIFGQDAVMFLQQQGQGLTLALDFSKTDPTLWRFLLLAPAWSLSVELCFYLIAPFIVHRVRLIGGLAVLSAAGALVGWHYGLDHDPWTYRFFPFALLNFLIGMLAERFLLPRMQAARGLLAPLAACAIFVGHAYLPLPEPLATIIAVGAIVALLPALFRFQHGRRWDVYLGDLSYPLYILHWLPLMVVPKLTGIEAGTPAALTVNAGIVIVVSLVGAVILEAAVARPVERIRRRIRRHPVPVDQLDTVETPQRRTSVPPSPASQ